MVETGRIAALVERLADAVVLVDAEGTICLVNAAGEELFGRSRSKLLGSDFGFASIDGESAEIEISTPRGVRIAELRTSPLEWDQGERYDIISLRDVTDQRELQEKYNHVQKMDAMGQLTGGIAHDFNNILAVVMGNLQLLERKLEPESPVMNFVRDALQASSRGAALTRQLLAFSRKQRLELERA